MIDATIGTHADYVQSWIKVLKDEKKQFLQRPAKPQKLLTSFRTSYPTPPLTDKSPSIIK
jgi:antirestriction protein ArdC